MNTREALAATYKQLQSESGDDDADSQTPVVSASGSDADSQDLQEPTDDSAAPAKKEPAEIPANALDAVPSTAVRPVRRQKKASGAPVEDAAPVSAAQPKPTAPAVAAPESWSDEAKNHFAAAPAELQKFLATREKETSQQIQSLNARSQAFESIERVMLPLRDRLESAGMSMATGVERLVSYQNLLDRNVAVGLASIARTYGVSLRQAADYLEGQQRAVNPEIAALQQQVQQIQSGTQQFQQQYQQANEQTRLAGIEAEVERFAGEKDAGGNLLRPHFDALATHIGPIAGRLAQENPQMPPNQILQAAYDEAVKPISHVLESDKTARLERAKRAKIAGGSISGAAGGPPAPQKIKNTRDAIIASYHQLNGA